MNNFLGQIKQFWNELGVNQRVSLVLAATMIVVGLTALLLWSSRPQMLLLYGGVDSKDMAAIVEELQSGGINYEIRNGNSIYVPRENVYQARMNLATQGIPSGGGIGFEIFDSTNFGVSDFVQRTNYHRAVQGELQRTITQLKGVRTARVMIVVPQNKLLITGDKQRPTASVFVDTGGTVLGSESVNSIRFLVANSVEGLQVDDVVVVDNNGNPLSQDLAQDEVVGAASGQFKFRRNLENYYTQKVESMLTRVVGLNNVVARVSVELNTESASILEERFDPDGQVIRSQTQADSNSSSVEQQPGGGGSSTTNQGADQTVVTFRPGASTQETNKEKTVQYEINKTTTELIRRPGTINNLSAAVFIALRQREENGELIDDPRSPEEMERLKVMVMNALGVNSSNPNAAMSVTISETAFSEIPENTPAGMDAIQQQVYTWMEPVRNFVAVGIAVMVFLMFLRMLKRHKPEPISLEVVDEIEVGRKEAEIQPKLTPELLNELIREKPENVSTALRNWAVDVQNK
ncbi:MAG: flagellar M-ring protein FliF [Opitutales bacterium]|nr:flagellar M-ring protein FliF [Opitutales bacterium]